MCAKKPPIQLEEIFDDLDGDPSILPYLLDQSLPGWIWECDASGRFVACSSEVEDVLGLRAQTFKGQLLSEFALSSESSSHLEEALNSEDFPVDLIVQYRKESGQRVAVRLHIFETASEEGERTGWRGFAQVLQKQEKEPKAETPTELEEVAESPELKVGEPEVLGTRAPDDGKALDERILEEAGELESETLDADTLQDHKGVPDTSEVEAPPQTTLERASLKIQELLEWFRAHEEAIQSSPESRLVVSWREEFREDRTKPPIPEGSFGGRTLFSYPKVLVREIEHRLEWGNKLALTPKEMEFLEENQFDLGGLGSIVRKRFAPESILEYNGRWISVMLVDEKDKGEHIWVHHSQAHEPASKISVEEFLSNPDILKENIETALDSPWESRSQLFKGKDYLVKR